MENRKFIFLFLIFLGLSNKIYLANSNVFDTLYRPHQDLYTNIYSIKTFVERKHKKHKII